MMKDSIIIFCVSNSRPWFPSDSIRAVLGCLMRSHRVCACAADMGEAKSGTSASGCSLASSDRAARRGDQTVSTREPWPPCLRQNP